ncbi:hypothetical protein DFH06DRAFT_1338173 [Mycena polygramma]|nr:hypothetical protein DFH06DRAFT_1338173 [Mycena polygramma]
MTALLLLLVPSTCCPSSHSRPRSILSRPPPLLPGPPSRAALPFLPVSVSPPTLLVNVMPFPLPFVVVPPSSLDAVLPSRLPVTSLPFRSPPHFTYPTFPYFYLHLAFSHPSLYLLPSASPHPGVHTCLFHQYTPFPPYPLPTLPSLRWLSDFSALSPRAARLILLGGQDPGPSTAHAFALHR